MLSDGLACTPNRLARLAGPPGATLPGGLLSPRATPAIPRSSGCHEAPALNGCFDDLDDAILEGEGLVDTNLALGSRLRVISRAPAPALSR